MKKVLTIGSAMRDVFIKCLHTDMLPVYIDQSQRSFITIEVGRKIEIDGLEYFIGGGAVNSAVSFLRLGCEVATFFKVGEDEYGKNIVDQLVTQGVNVDHVVHAKNESTGVSLIIPCANGERSTFVCRGANLTIAQQEVPYALVHSVDVVYVTSLAKQASVLLPSIVDAAKKGNALVAVNPGTSQLKDNVESLKASLHAIDILMMNSFEATLLMQTLVQTNMANRRAFDFKQSVVPQLLAQPLGLESARFTLPQFFYAVSSRGPRIVVVTNGAEGVYVFDGSTIYFHPVVPGPVVSTLGAGDAFNSTFTAYIAQGLSIPQAMRAGMCNAAHVLQHVGAQTGLLSAQELEAAIARLEATLLQQFSL
jgi:sugar/nucleoside kinase (ribokinase family)